MHATELDESKGVEVRSYRNADRKRKRTKGDQVRLTVCAARRKTNSNRLHTDEALILKWGKSAVNQRFQKSVVAYCPIDDCETNTTRPWYWYYHSTSRWWPAGPDWR